MKNYLNSKPMKKITRKDEIVKKSSFCSSNNSSILESCMKNGPIVPLGSTQVNQKPMLTIN